MWREFQVCSDALFHLLWDIDAKKNDLQKEFKTYKKGAYRLINNLLSTIKSTYTSHIASNKLDGCNKPSETVKTMNGLDRQTRLALTRIADLEHSINLI